MFLASIIRRKHEDKTSGPFLMYGYYTMILHDVFLPLVPNITYKLDCISFHISFLV